MHRICNTISTSSIVQAYLAVVMQMLTHYLKNLIGNIGINLVDLGLRRSTSGKNQEYAQMRERETNLRLQN